MSHAHILPPPSTLMMCTVLGASSWDVGTAVAVIQHGGEAEGDHDFEELEGEHKSLTVYMLHCVVD